MDMVELIVDLTQRPANPRAYFRCVEGLAREARNSGYHPKISLLVLDSTPGIDTLIDHSPFASSLRIGGADLKEIGHATALALGKAPALFLSAGATLPSNWISRALKRFSEGGNQAILFPEIGVFFDRNEFEFLDYSSPMLEHSPLLGVSGFAPVCLGPGRKVATLLEKGALLGDPFSRSTWLESQKELLNERLIPVERSAFFIDRSLSGPLESGLLKRYPKVHELRWLETELKKIRALDPKVPVRHSVELARLRYPAAAETAHLKALEASIPTGLKGIFLTESSEDGIETRLIESLAQTSEGAKFLVINLRGTERSEVQRDSSIVFHLGIEEEFRDIEFSARPRVLAMLFSLRAPEFIHLFETSLTTELARTLVRCGTSPASLSLSILPNRGWPTATETSLAAPEALQELEGVRVVTFEQGGLLSKSMYAYRLSEASITLPWEPWKWRAVVSGEGGSEPRVSSCDAEIALKMKPCREIHEASSWLGLDHAFASCSPVLRKIKTTLPCVFVAAQPSARCLPQEQFVLARDGALSLIQFFSRNRFPDGFTGNLLVDDRFGELVPERWRENVLLYRFRSRTRMSSTPERLLLTGFAYSALWPPEALETELERVRRKLETLPLSSLLFYFPNPSWAWSEALGATFLQEFVRKIRRTFRGHSISWFDGEELATLPSNGRQVFHELNAGTLYAFDSNTWSLLSQGALPLFDPEEGRGTPEHRIVLSSNHWLEAYRPRQISKPVDTTALRSTLFSLANSGVLSDVLTRSELI